MSATRRKGDEISNIYHEVKEIPHRVTDDVLDHLFPDKVVGVV